MLSSTGHNLSHAATFCPNICRLKTLHLRKTEWRGERFAYRAKRWVLKYSRQIVNFSPKTSKLGIIFLSRFIKTFVFSICFLVTMSIKIKINSLFYLVTSFKSCMILHCYIILYKDTRVEFLFCKHSSK